MKLVIDLNRCIGCALCPTICPNEFELIENHKARTRNEPVKTENIDDVTEAIDSCPTSAILEI